MASSRSYARCANPACRLLIAPDDLHGACIACMGRRHALDALEEDPPVCLECRNLPLGARRLRLDTICLLSGLASTVSPGLPVGRCGGDPPVGGAPPGGGASVPADGAPPPADGGASPAGGAPADNAAPSADGGASPAHSIYSSEFSFSALDHHDSEEEAFGEEGDFSPTQEPDEDVMEVGSPVIQLHPDVNDSPLSTHVSIAAVARTPAGFAAVQSQAASVTPATAQAGIQAGLAAPPAPGGTVPAISALPESQASSDAGSSSLTQAAALSASQLPPSGTVAASSGANGTSPPLPMDPWSVLERAARLQSLTVPVRQQPATSCQPRLGVDRAPTLPPVMACLPAITGLQQVLQETWATHKDPEKLAYPTEFEGAQEMGVPRCPHISPALASMLQARFLHDKPGGTSPYSLSGVHPLLEDKWERFMAKATQEAYRADGHAVRALNAAGLLAAYVKLLQNPPASDPPLDVAAEIKASLDLLIELNFHAMAWVGRSMDQCMQMESTRWLEPIDWKKDEADKKELRNLPSSGTEIMAGGLALFQARAAANRETRELVGETVPSTPAAQSSQRSSNRQRTPRSIVRVVQRNDYRDRASGSSSRSSSRGGSRARAHGPPPPSRPKEDRHQQRSHPRSAKGRGRQQRK